MSVIDMNNFGKYIEPKYVNTNKTIFTHVEKDAKLDTFRLVEFMYLVKPEEVKNTIIRVKEFENLRYLGTVVKVNYNKYNNKGVKIIPGLDVGDRVYFGRVTYPIEIENVEYLMMDEDWIYCKVDENTNIKPTN